MYDSYSYIYLQTDRITCSFCAIVRSKAHCINKDGKIAGRSAIYSPQFVSLVFRLSHFIKSLASILRSYFLMIFYLTFTRKSSYPVCKSNEAEPSRRGAYSDLLHQHGEISQIILQRTQHAYLPGFSPYSFFFTCR